MSRLFVVFGAAVLIIGAAVYLLVLVPTMSSLETAFLDAGTMGSSEETQMDRIQLVALRIVPVIIGIGAVLWVYVSMTKRQARAGRRRF